MYASMLNMGAYFMKYVLGNENLLGDFSLAINIPLIAGLLITPWLVKKMKGMYMLCSFQQAMEANLGEGSCHVLGVRTNGGIRVQ